MVQRKAPRWLGLETKVSGKQDTSSKSGGGRGDDLSHKTRKPSPVRTSGGSPNYMKPTSSSDARKERSQVTIQPPNINRNPRNQVNLSDRKPARSLTRNPSLKPVRSSMKKSSGTSRTTCSSTLKDSKSPKDLALNPGGTESEGASIMKVCPYTYCSLNGHTHEPLPPLQSFMSARRRLVKNQNSSMKLKRLSSLVAISRIPSGLDFNWEMLLMGSFNERKIQEKHNAENPEVLDELSQTEDNWEDTDDQIYQSNLESNYVDDLDLSRGLSDEEMDVLMNSIEYVEARGENPCIGQKNYAEWDSFAGKTDYSEYLGDGFDPILNPLLEIIDAGGNSSFTNETAGDDTEMLHGDKKVIANGDENTAITMLGYGLYDSSILQVQFSNYPQGSTKTDHGIAEFDCREIEMEIFNGQLDEQKEETRGNRGINEDCIELNGTLQTRGGVSPCAEEDTTIDAPTLTFVQHLTDARNEPKERYNMARVKTTEDKEEIREFNPRPPRFLPVEHDPEAEKVHLRHQLMDERKNAKEWMIDYALQRVVTKLAPARKRKVELLVEAFETIMPLPMYETPLQAISRFTHAVPIQACS